MSTSLKQLFEAKLMLRIGLSNIAWHDRLGDVAEFGQPMEVSVYIQEILD